MLDETLAIMTVWRSAAADDLEAEMMLQNTCFSV